MLIKLEFEGADTVVVDHTKIMVEVQCIKPHGKVPFWMGGIYVHDGVENREEPLYQVPGSFILSHRRLVYSSKFKDKAEANLFLEKTRDYVNKQLNIKESPLDISSIVEQLKDNNTMTFSGIHKLLKASEELIELLTPKPKTPRKKKEDAK